ncbi:MAG: protein phosphatase 2C domain-containing protein [Eubacterium sp.]|nr:protein phosphatase 2C domain-containing protein [Eubacterium sp.]
MREAYKIGNAQSIGSYQIQSSYFASACSDKGCLAVLADGTADHPNGRRCAVLAVEACMQEYQKIQGKIKAAVFFERAAAKILRDMREIIFLGKTPYLSLSIQWFKGRELFYYSVGSNQVFLYDGSNYRLLKTRSGTVDFAGGMTAGMITRGVSEAFREKEMLAYLCGKEHPYDKAQRMILGVKQKNRKMARTAAILFIEGCL